MFSGFWTFLQGYVAIEVTGTSVERFLNLAAHKGIVMWDVSPISNGISMHCSIRSFRMLRSCAKKTKCRLKIARRVGAPFLMHRYRRRKILMGGIAFFVLFLYAMSSFVWRIDVEGNDRLSSDKILEFSQNHGLRIGAFKHFVDHREIGRQLLFQFSDIAWADVHTRGTRTTIIISETIPEQPHISRDTPCHIVAAQDGLIISIATASGFPKVRQNDVVRQGDVLVSGILPVQTEATGQSTIMFVHAYAEVWAKMYTPIRLVVPMSYTHQVFTGNERSHYTLQWLLGRQGSINLFHGSIPYTEYDKMVSYTQPGASGDYPLPLIWTRVVYREFVPETRHRTVDEAKALANRIITEHIIREFDFEADIIDKQIQFEEQADQLTVSALITTHQRIDKAVPIEESELNHSPEQHALINEAN